jgi:hypothetical protein
MPSKTLGALLVAVVAASGSEATTLVVLGRDGAVYLGADSWRSRTFADKPTGDFVCKIRRYGDVLVASAGFSEDANPKVGLDFVGAFTEASQRWSGTLEQKADILGRAAQSLIGGLIQARLDAEAELRRNAEKLDRAAGSGADANADLRKRINRLRVDNAKVLERFERERQQLILVNIDGQRPSVAIRVIAARHDGQTAAPTMRPEVFDGFTIKALDSAYRRMTATERRALQSLKPQDLVHTLIEKQARETPTLVRLPANVVTIAASGYKWVEAGDACKTLHLIP